MNIRRFLQGSRGLVHRVTSPRHILDIPTPQPPAVTSNPPTMTAISVLTSHRTPFLYPFYLGRSHIAANASPTSSTSADKSYSRLAHPPQLGPQNARCSPPPKPLHQHAKGLIVSTYLLRCLSATAFARRELTDHCYWDTNGVTETWSSGEF